MIKIQMNHTKYNLEWKKNALVRKIHHGEATEVMGEFIECMNKENELEKFKNVFSADKIGVSLGNNLE